MKILHKIIPVLLLFISTGICAQIKNEKTERVKISGNCEMCKATIEKAGSLPNVSQVVWDLKTQTATVTYDSKKTSLDTILKKIAQSGYSSDKYKAKDSNYNRLPVCCQYEK